MFKWKNQENCFLKMNCTGKPNEPAMTEEQIHEAVQNNFHPSKIEENYDAIVIGSGISGLTVARVLAASGKKVVVLEQHDRAGGSCHTFDLEEYEFDVGLHYVQDMVPGKELYRICSALSDSHVQWQAMQDPFDVAIIGQERYERNAGDMKDFQKQLKEWFPTEQDKIDAYFNYVSEALAGTPWFFRAKFMPQLILNAMQSNFLSRHFLKVFRYSGECVLDVMRRFELNETLQTLIGYYFVNYGIPPNRASFFQHSLFLMNNGYYPIGGVCAMVANIIRSLRKFDAQVFVKADVKQIVFDGRNVRGVLVKYGSMNHLLKSNLVISTAPVMETFNNLIPPSIAEKSSVYCAANKLHQLDRVKYAGLQAYIGLRGTAQELQLPSNNYFYFKNNDVTEYDRFASLPLSEALEYGCPPIVYITFPSAKDPKWDERHPGISTCQLISFANPQWFDEFHDKSDKKSQKRLNPQEYKSLKSHFGELMVDQLLVHFPHVKKHISFVEFSTPLTQQYFMQNTYGSYYGLTQQVERFTEPFWCELRCKTDLPGLYLSGQDVLFCGVSSAFHSGLLTAGSILNRDLCVDLKAAYQEQIQSAQTA